MTPPRWWPGAAALLAGALGLLVFPAPDLAYLAWVVLVPALLLLRAAAGWRAAAVRGWLVGTGFLAATQYWVLPNLTAFFPLAVAALGLLWAPWGVLSWWLLRGRLGAGRALAALAGVPAGWVLVEAVRSWQYLGGPWALLGASQWRHPTALGLAAVGGVWLAGFAVVLANVGVVLVVTDGWPRGWAHGWAPRLVGGGAVLVAVTAGPAWYAAQAEPEPSSTLRVALVQPGVQPGPAARLEAEERLTAATAGAADLVVWGESSVGYDLGRRPDVLARLTALSRTTGADLLVDVDARTSGGGIAKTAVLVGPGGVRGTYTKTRLVPFGEYVPFRGQLGWLSHITEAAGENRRRGHGPVILRTGAVTLGPLTSFEETFPDLARTAAERGARLVVYQSSTSTFQDSWAPAQLAAFGAVRAAETGRPVVHAALTGASAAYDVRGRRLGFLGAAHRGVLRVDVPLAATRTPYDRFGDYVPVACAGIVAVLLIVFCRRLLLRSARLR